MPRAAADLPTGPLVMLPRRGLSAQEAALYIGISRSKFMMMVQDGSMPAPREIGTRNIWDIHDLDAAFDALPHGAASRLVIAPDERWRAE